MPAVDAELTAFLESGCSTIIGAITSDGRPFASRGWGTVVQDGGTKARVLMSKTDIEQLGYDVEIPQNASFAVTGANVSTLRSTQFKGHVLSVEPMTEADHGKLAAYCDQFFEDVYETDSIPRSLMERLVPQELVACTVAVDELFNQTPGPGAGAPLRSE